MGKDDNKTDDLDNGRQLQTTMENLKSSERRYKSMFQNMQNSTTLYRVITDEQGKPLDYEFLAANPIFESLVMMKEAELKGKTLLRLFPQTEQSWRDALEKVVLTGDPIVMEDYSIALDKWFELTFYSPEEGNIAMIGKDITKRKKAEEEHRKLTEQLHQSQKMEAVGLLAGGIAHDFNNSLSGIIGAAEILKNSDCSKEKTDKFLNLIINTADRAAALTRKLLLFSRKGERSNCPVDMKDILDDSAELLKHLLNKKITLTVENRADNGTILGDVSLLQNVFVNMAINSGHAMPGGGTLAFTMENVYLDEAFCDFSSFELKPGEYLNIAVEDTGRGMSPDVVSRIFEPFFTTKEQGKGTGLGLSMVYGTVRDHKGAVTVYSEEGVGTIFHIYFPVVKDRVNDDRADSVPTGTGTILIIDDEQLIRLTAKSMLESLGYTVVCAENGLRGVGKLEEMGEDIDLVLLDMIMPVMNGPETLEKLRESVPDIPVIIASGFSKQGEWEIMEKRHISGFLSKPFHRAELASMVYRILNRDMPETRDSRS